MAKFVNLTQHPITIVCKDGSVVTVEPSGMVFRLREKDVVVANISGVDVVRREFTISPEDLKVFSDPSAIYIVSLPALMALSTINVPELDGLWIVAPDTGKGGIRDEKGNIVGTRQLVIL